MSATLLSWANERAEPLAARGHGGLAFFVWVFLAVVTPLVIWLQVSLADEVAAAAYLSVLPIQYCAARLALLAWSGRTRLLTVTFHVFMYVWGGIAPLVQNCSWTFPWLTRHLPWDAVIGLAQIMLTLVVYDVGQALARRARGGPTRWTIDLSLNKVVLLSAMALPLAAAGMMMLGGPKILFMTRAAFEQSMGREIGGQISTIWVGSALLRAPPFVALVLMTILALRTWRTADRDRKRLLLGLLVLLAGLNVLFNFPLALARQWLGTIVLTPVFIMAWRARPTSALLALGLVLLLLFVYPYSDALRRAVRFDWSFIEHALQTRMVDKVLHTGDFDVYQQTLNNIVVVRNEGIAYGSNFVGAALFWFPRSVWQGKPEGTAHIVARAVGYPWHQWNLSAALWMEAYWGFGWLGLVGIMGAYGYGSRRLDDSLLESRRDPARATMFEGLVPFLAAYQFILLRGELLAGTASLAFPVLLFLLAARLGSRQSKGAS